MQPQVEQPESWQQPRQAVPQAPYQPVPEPVSPAPPVEPALPSPQPALDAMPAEETISPQVVVEELYDQEAADEEQGELSESDEATEALLSWDAAEYVHQQQTPLWFGSMTIIVLLFMAVAFLVMKSITFTILIPVMAAALVVYVMRPPATNHYTLSRKGLHINDRLYSYSEFKSFGVLSQGGNHAAVLVPRKRFQLGHTIYFPEEVGEQVVDMFAQRLPMKEVNPDIIDRLLARLRL